MKLRGQLPRYVRPTKLADGSISYRFNPPKEYIDEGVVSRSVLGNDLRKVRPIAKELNDKIDAYKEYKKENIVLQKRHTVNDLVKVYTKSNDFLMLRQKTQADYIYFLSILQKSVGTKKYLDITTYKAKHMYEEWVKQGIHLANHVCAVSNKLYNFAIDMGYAQVNPFAGVKKKTPKQRKVVWTEQDIVQFLDYAYSNFDSRSVGLIVHMAYEWCQRVGDMRMLKWDNIDFKNKRMMLEQSKRRSHVHLPISDDLFEMLQQQYNEFGFQPYVAPSVVPTGGVYEPYGIYALSKKGRAIMKQAGLSDELRLMDLRRTGTTEMVEAGVSMAQIMSVTGHANPQSVKPYMKHTYESANSALTTRKKYATSISTADMEKDIS